MPTTTLPSEIKVEDILPTGCRYILPRRELGVWRWSGLFFILFGVMGMSQRLNGLTVKLPDRTQQPAGSRVVFEPLADGLMLSLPRAGLRAGARGVWGFALAWNGFFGIVAWLIVSQGGLDMGSIIGFIVFLTIFFLIGITLLGVALQTSLWAVELVVSDGRLFVLQTGLLGKSKREFGPYEIAHIRAGQSSDSASSEPLYELEIVPREGSALTLLQGRGQNELAWMATMLRQALRVPAEKGAESEVMECCDDGKPGDCNPRIQ